MKLINSTAQSNHSSPCKERPCKEKVSLTARYQEYLEAQNLSAVSIKNYLADLRKFREWFSSKSLRERQKHAAPGEADFQAYYQYLLKQHTPEPSRKRYLSSLKKFGEFLAACGETTANPAQSLSRISGPDSTANTLDRKKLLDEYKQFLEKEKMSSMTIKNYLADTRQFLGWWEQNQLS